MHELLVRELVKQVRQRISEGDCPITPALSVEQLENLVDQLASDLARERLKVKIAGTP
jgi:hypothetical protein